MDKSNKRQAIIDAAIKLFVENSVHATSMQTLAKAAGVATGSIYTYFDSKDALILEICESIFSESIEMSLQDYDPSQPIKARFCHLLERYMRFDIANPDKFHFVRRYIYEPVVMESLGQEDMCKESPLAIVVEQGKTEGLVRDLPVNDLFCQVFGGTDTFLEWRMLQGLPISDSDIDNVLDMAWHAIKK